MKLTLPAIAGLVVSATLWSCQTTPTKTTSPVTATAPATPVRENRGIDLASRDTTTSPADDFYRYVNGHWLDHTELPETEGRWGSWNELIENNQLVLRQVLEKAAAGNSTGHGEDERKVAAFFASGMDSVRIEKEGLQPLQPMLAQINQLKDKKQLQTVVANLQRKGASPYFGTFTNPDQKQSSKVALHITQSGLGLPDRDYYFNKDQKSEEIRKEYVAHITRMMQLAGESPEKAKASAAAVMKLETDLAKASYTRLEQRDTHRQYNKMSVAQLSKLAPAIDWKKYFSELGTPITIDTVIVRQPEFIKQINTVMQTYPLAEQQTYLRWKLVSRYAPYLSSQFEQESFRFNSTVLSGVKQMKPRWKRVVNTTGSGMGEALGKLYVAEVFPPEAKQTALEMVTDVKTAFAARIQRLDWMSEPTKKQALTKLSTLAVKIGYPDNWRDYSALQITDGHYATNVMAATEFEVQRKLNKLGKPVDRTEWGMSPQTVNAYFNPTMNEIVFPAAILQPPFFDYKADAAVNYGGIGAVIGHEITHGFDDQGRQYDAHGNLKDWWTPEDAKRFNEKAARVIKQFDGYEALPGMHVNGSLTVGENIADLGGLAVAYDALQMRLKKDGHPGKIAGYTPEQRFYMSWATVWRTKYREETLRQRLITDVHSPGNFRAIGPTSNLEEFYRAFDVQPGNKMYRDDSVRAKIW